MRHLPAAIATMSVRGKRITSCIRTELRESIHGKALTDYIKERNDWTDSTFDLVDWDSYEMALKRLPNESKTRHIKYAHDWLPVGCQQHHIYRDHNPTCPTCKAEGLVEKTDHVFSCPKRKPLREKCLYGLRTNLSKIHTNTIIADTICRGIRNRIDHPFRALRQVQHPHPDRLTDLLDAAVTEQNKIGWGNFLKGRISSKWGDAQQVHYSRKFRSDGATTEKQQAKKYNSGFFQMMVIKEIWRMFECLWEDRNEDCHSLTAKDATNFSLRQKRMHDKVRALYVESRQMMLADKNKLFPEDINKIFRKRPQQIEKWIIDASKAVQIAFERNETLASNPITDYFPLLSSSDTHSSTLTEPIDDKG